MATYHLRMKNDTKPNGVKVSARKHVDYIMREDSKKHAEYINREGKQNSDCVYRGEQLPRWANGSAQKFFEAATRYEDKGNRRYKELELSLPNELTLEQNREIVDRFIEAHLKNHYYAYAIHDKKGALSNQQHPHVHIMFSERLIDDVEKVKERPVSRYFKRAAKALKGEEVASFERRREHGAPKDKKWHDKNYLKEIRADFAKIQNEVLAKNGFSVRVDHRTLKAQKEEAERNGDETLVKLYNRKAEKNIGIISSHSKNQELENLQQYRKMYYKRRDIIFELDFSQRVIEELEAKDLAQEATILANAFINSEEYKAEKFDAENLQLHNRKILALMKEVNGWKRNLISKSAAEERARLEYMSQFERKQWRKYKESLSQRHNLEKLLAEIIRPTENQPKTLEAYKEIMSGIQEEISSLKNETNLLKPEIDKIEKKLKTPDRRNNMQLVTHKILQENSEVRSELKKSSEQLLDLVRYLQKELNPTEPETEIKNIFTLKEVKEILRQQYHDLKNEHEKLIDRGYELQWKVITPMRAMKMAENIFVNGGYKKLREQKRQYKKEEARYFEEFSDYQQRARRFPNRKFKDEAEKYQEKYYLQKQQITLPARNREIEKMKLEIENEEVRLRLFCDKPEAQQKIQLIAAGILRKDLKISKEYENVKSRSKEISQRLKKVKEQLKNLKEKYPKEKKNRYYRVVLPETLEIKNPPTDKMSLVSIIADALNGEKYAVQLVACLSGNNLEMEKNWDMLSEMEKDELETRRILREL